MWRSVVFLPLMVATFVMVGGLFLIRWTLPFVAILFGFTGQWTHAGGRVLAWLASVLIHRYLRLARFQEDPPSLL